MEGFERVFGVKQLLVMRGQMGAIKMVVSKIKYEILMGGSVTQTEEIAEIIRKRFDIRKVIIDGAINFIG